MSKNSDEDMEYRNNNNNNKIKDEKKWLLKRYK